MRRLAGIALVVALALAGCKTTEENYRASYEAAVGRRNAEVAAADSVEATIHNRIMEAEKPRKVDAGGKQVAFLEGNAWQLRELDTNKMMRYSVVVGAMRQLFNAKAFCSRLLDLGCKSYVLVDAKKNYFVVAEGFDTFDDAAAYLLGIGDRLSIKLPLEEPFVYRTTRL